MYNFTPLSALAGGILIGLSAVLLLTVNGRIAGISGIVHGIVAPEKPNDLDWRLLFLVGLIAGAFLYRLLNGMDTSIALEASILIVGGGGILTGIGTAVGSGCTSGHGICGLARRSSRSLAATISFMLVGGITVFILRHVIGG
ncbi:MAG TPA: YeeE/YedE family protein [Alphaproteobacteria bacterium]|nr:YeeE/YedE family protein [Alphaproteobacteria bacterium]HIB57024.1 YeeE/YedE family protein [Alphaproteobacteria bacterium]HIM72938.1 YeeE/YedE family protein [Alphaproteobacteria bacterium]HIO03203.1 YeeE/YedE family protein [Alphaproteobacteria bacterium]